MGLGQSTEDATTSSPEELSRVLAERFAIKCFTPLELTHFKDNFYTRAVDNGGLKYWNEKTLSDFLGIPDGIKMPSGPEIHDCPLDAGPVIFRMASYLGAFPFQNTLAPSVLTFEAMVKVAVLLTERYQKSLRRGPRDRIKLLFGSLADVGRKDIGQPTDTESSQKKEEGDAASSSQDKSRPMGFAVDEPGNDGDEDDEDDLALAALESLDAIEVVKHDQRINKSYEAWISVDTFRRLLMLLLVIAPLKPLEPVARYTSDLNAERMEAVQKEADSILAAFQPEDAGISYKSFARTVSSTLPYLFDPLTPLFEHLLFSKNLDLSQRRNETDPITSNAVGKHPEAPSTLPTSAVVLSGSFESSILNPSILSHISFFLTCSPTVPNLFRSGMRLHPVFSTAQQGSSLTSFSHHVLTWQSATLLVLQGTQIGSESSGREENILTLGVYLPEPWKTSSAAVCPKPDDSSSLPCLFQLSPKHMLLQGNPAQSIHKPNTPAAYFSPHSGIAIGCQIPPPARSHHYPPIPHGAGSMIIDTNLETADLVVSPIRTDGVFLHPKESSETTTTSTTTTKIRISIYTLEVWGFLFPPSAEPGSSPDALELQRAMWNFESREAERRRNVNLKAGGDPSSLDNARWLLEAAGLIGDETGRSGGSV